MFRMFQTGPLTDSATVNTSYAPRSVQPTSSKSVCTRITIKVKVKVRTWGGMEIGSTRL